MRAVSLRASRWRRSRRALAAENMLHHAVVGQERVLVSGASVWQRSNWRSVEARRLLQSARPARPPRSKREARTKPWIAARIWCRCLDADPSTSSSMWLAAPNGHNFFKCFAVAAATRFQRYRRPNRPDQSENALPEGLDARGQQTVQHIVQRIEKCDDVKSLKFDNNTNPTLFPAADDGARTHARCPRPCDGSMGR